MDCWAPVSPKILAGRDWPEQAPCCGHRPYAFSSNLPTATDRWTQSLMAGVDDARCAATYKGRDRCELIDGHEEQGAAYHLARTSWHPQFTWSDP